MKDIINKSCKQCSTHFSTTRTDKDFCTKECRQLWFKINNRQNFPITNCKFCNSEFKPTSIKQTCCTIKCTRDLSNKRIRDAEQSKFVEENAHILDMPTCRICGWKSRTLHTHLRIHNLSVEAYLKKYNLTESDVHHSSYLQELSEKVSGSNNPGYQHNGTMSSFSKKFRNYTTLTENDKVEKINKQILKANKTKRENCSYTTTLEYYISKGHSLEEATEMRRNRQQTFSLDICIEKYGVVEGFNRWKQRQDKWINTLDNLPDDVKHQIAVKKLAAISQTYSRVSIELFDEINKHYPGFYGPNEVLIHTTLGYRKPDFLCNYKIIEFFGDLWHASPLKYEPDQLVLEGFGSTKTAQQIWETDNHRIAAFRDCGFEVLIIWEHEYRRDKLGVIKRCLDFLK